MQSMMPLLQCICEATKHLIVDLMSTLVGSAPCAFTHMRRQIASQILSKEVQCAELTLSLGCMSQDNSKAAKLLAEHGQVTAAINRLMRPLHQAAKLGQPASRTWADKDTLSQLYTLCTSLGSPWALQQVMPTLDSQQLSQLSILMNALTLSCTISLQ